MDDLPEKYRQDIAFIKATAEQIKKDLGLRDIDFLFSSNDHMAFEELKSQLIPMINMLRKSGPQQISSMLYRVDISENEFKKTIANSPSDYSSTLAEMIIRREFKKVIIRKYFSDIN